MDRRRDLVPKHRLDEIDAVRHRIKEAGKVARDTLQRIRRQGEPKNTPPPPPPTPSGDRGSETVVHESIILDFPVDDLGSGMPVHG